MVFAESADEIYQSCSFRGEVVANNTEHIVTVLCKNCNLSKLLKQLSVLKYSGICNMFNDIILLISKSRLTPNNAGKAGVAIHNYAPHILGRADNISPYG
jgi:hypothetical protein